MSRRPIHIHIYKTAGTAIREALGITDPVHLTADRLRRSLGAEMWRSGYPFAFVRNPFARYWSFYRAMRHERLGSFRVGWTFDEWMHHIFETHNRWSFPQTWWLLDPKRRRSLVPPDHVYRFEQMETEWPRLLENLEMPFFPLEVIRKSPGDREYRRHYSPELRAFLERHHASDFKMLEYEF